MSDPATVNVVVTVAMSGKVVAQATADTADPGKTIRAMLGQLAEHSPAPLLAQSSPSPTLSNLPTQGAGSQLGSLNQ